jgi:hypothetical protein
MSARARHSTAKTVYGAFDAEERYARPELWPGERIAPPPSGSSGKVILRGVLVILLALGGGWALRGDWAIWSHWQSIEAAVSSWMSRSVPEPVEPAASVVATGSLPARIEPSAQPSPLDAPPSIGQSPASSKSQTAPGPGVTARSEAPPLTTAALPPAATAYESPAPPTADRADPYHMRAAAAGLHPDLSRVLLERLSPTDYRNAGIAIQTAMAETPDGGVLVWPRQRKPELALFTVRFVPGAAPGCRRYVVTVTKDGWLTTALPMEKCGPQTKGAASKASGRR